jgi:hypothetical protein
MSYAALSSERRRQSSSFKSRCIATEFSKYGTFSLETGSIGRARRPCGTSNEVSADTPLSTRHIGSECIHTAVPFPLGVMVLESPSRATLLSGPTGEADGGPWLRKRAGQLGWRSPLILEASRSA